jgi:ABC-type sugar transport system substrate-binding protein
MPGRGQVSRRFLVTALLVCFAGCDSVGTGTGAPAGPPPAPPPDSAKSFAFIPPSKALELSLWTQAARVEAARHRSLVELVPIPEKPTQTWQAEAIREAVARGVSAIIVVPDESADLTQAIQESVEATVPVVQMLRQVAEPGSETPLVTYSSLDDSAGDLVKAAVDDARAAGFPADGPALLMRNGGVSLNGLDRAEALEKAAKNAGLRLVPSPDWKGYSKDAEAVLRAALAEHPDLAIVLVDEGNALNAASTVRNSIASPQRPFVTAGYTTDKNDLDLAGFGMAAAVADLNLTASITQAVRTAHAVASGEKTSPIHRIQVTLSRASGPALSKRKSQPKAIGTDEPPDTAVKKPAG